MTCKDCQHQEVCRYTPFIENSTCKHFKGYFQPKVEWMGQGKVPITAEQFEKIYNDGDDEEE